MTPRVSLRQALSDQSLLGNVLVGRSWNTWKPILLATVGEPLTPGELATFTEVTGRSVSPSSRVEEAAFVIGRRGGKDRGASILATYFAALCDHPMLAPGERGVVLCIGADQRQAKVTRDYVEAVLASSPILSKLVTGTTQDTISLSTGVDVEVRAASFRRNRGLTAVAVVATESAFWMGEDSSNPDTEILNALRPALATTGGPLIQISSPYARRGELWETFKRHYGPAGDPSILVVQGTSRKFNPTLSEGVVQRAMERDAASASAEFMAQFRSDLEAFVSREAVEACVSPGVFERAPKPGVRYVGFVDPSGGSADSFAMAIAHREKDVAVLDLCRERKPPFSPGEVCAELAATLRSYGISSAHSDRYAGTWPEAEFAKHRIKLLPAEQPKSGLYLDLLPAINSGRVDLLDNPKLINQLVALERRTSRGGKDVIDHPSTPGAHDDVCNAAAGALKLGSRCALVVTDAMLARASIPVRTQGVRHQRLPIRTSNPIGRVFMK